jgi:hypothetical protein
MDPCDERPAVVRAAGHVGEPRAGVDGERPRPIDRLGVIGEPRPRHDEPGISRLPQRGRDGLDLRTVPTLLLLQEPRFVARTAEDVLGDVPEPRVPRMQDDDPRARGGGLPQPEVQDRHLLLGIETRDEDHLRFLDVPIRDGHPASRDRAFD